jgi:hypothetical protein
VVDLKARGFIFSRKSKNPARPMSSARLKPPSSLPAVGLCPHTHTHTSLPQSCQIARAHNAAAAAAGESEAIPPVEPSTTTHPAAMGKVSRRSPPPPTRPLGAPPTTIRQFAIAGRSCGRGLLTDNLVISSANPIFLCLCS